jgi:DNA-binding NarL/FixJ family response regulator
MVAPGTPYKEIGAQTGRSWKTINNSVAQIRAKFGAGSRSDSWPGPLRRGVVRRRRRFTHRIGDSHARQRAVAAT